MGQSQSLKVEDVRFTKGFYDGGETESTMIFVLGEAQHWQLCIPEVMEKVFKWEI